jgi:Ankyrin repeats (3 copies)/Zinc finger, C3HC4 type (RING finger)/Ankyrin repeat
MASLFALIESQRKDAIQSLLESLETPTERRKLVVEETLKENGRCALHLAAAQKSAEVIRILLSALQNNENESENERGENCESESFHACDDVRDCDGQTPLHVAAYHASRAIGELIRNGSSCEFNAVDKRAQSAIHVAAARGNVSSLRQLVAAGASVSLKDADGRKAIDLAADARVQRFLAAKSGGKSELSAQERVRAKSERVSERAASSASGLTAAAKQKSAVEFAELRAELRELRAQLACVLCEKARRTCVVLPCSHLFYCRNCLIQATNDDDEDVDSDDTPTLLAQCQCSAPIQGYIDAIVD